MPRVGAMKAIVDVLGSPDSPCSDGARMMPSAVVEDEFARTASSQQQLQEESQQHDDVSSTLINSEAINTDDCGKSIRVM